MPEPLDVHCPNCKQVIVPADRMMLLLNVRPQERKAETLSVPHVQTMIIINADFICPNCRRTVYFRLNEQRLSQLLERVSRE